MTRPALSGTAKPVIRTVLVEETALDPGVVCVCKHFGPQFGDRLRVAYDPAQLDRARLDAVLRMFVPGYREYRAQTAETTA